MPERLPLGLNQIWCYHRPMSWDLMRELAAWQERLGRLAPHAAEPWSPPIDVYETADAYVVMAEVPGLSRDEIDLALEGTRLTIRAVRRGHDSGAGEIVRYHQIERGYGAFARTFEFVEEVDVNGVSADLTNGVLYITLPKAAAPPRRIEVR